MGKGFARPCYTCGKRFEPTGRNCRNCDSCLLISALIGNARSSITFQKNIALRKVT